MLAAARAREAAAEAERLKQRAADLAARKSSQYLPASRGFAAGHRE